MNNSRYGLIKPSQSKPSIFNESDSDSDDNNPRKNRPTGLNQRLKTQDKLNRNRAIEEDPTVYQYDEIYDEMTEKRKQTKLAQSDIDRKPKYIKRLLETAERRKRENERRIERQVQKEREQEGDEFRNKESFVTSAYKKKLEEMRELDEEDRREEYLEAIGDVRKQGNLDGFYRHLYDQKVNFEEEGEKQEVKKKSGAKKRLYRKRENCAKSDDSEDESKGQINEKICHLTSNLDADSDFSIDDSSDENDDDNNKEEVKIEKVEVEQVEKIVEEKKDEEKMEEVVKKPKIDIWKKRTIGNIFDGAVQRYFERKALRETGL